MTTYTFWKNEFIFYLRMSRLCKSVQYTYRSKNLFRLSIHRRRSIPYGNPKYLPSWLRFSKIRKTYVVWQRKATKSPKIYNARAQLLFCSLNLLFGDVPVAVRCRRGLLKAKFRRRTSHEPNQMQMSKILCSPSFAFDSAHVKYGVWTWPKFPNRGMDKFCVVWIDLKNVNYDG